MFILSFMLFSIVWEYTLANNQQFKSYQSGRDVPYFNCTADRPLNISSGNITEQFPQQTALNGGTNPLLVGLLGTFGITSMISMFSGKNDIFSAGFGLLAFNVIVNYLRDFCRWIGQYLYAKVTYSITVKNTDECFDWLLEWFSEQKFMTDTHNMAITTSRGANVHDPYGDNDDKQAPTVKYQPASGNHTIWYKGKVVTFARQKDESADKTKISQELLTVTVYDSNKNLLRELVQEAVSLALKKQKKKITISIFEYDYWSRAVAKEKRDIDSVFLDNEMKQALETDVKFFLDNKDWYLRRGIPYRRGYLLYGPPGTGKTSSIIAIAGKFNLDISILNLNSPSMEDNKLISAVSDQPRNSILVMEDVDALFVKRQSAADGASKVSFAGLLNALDGIATVDGRILFMTTNHIDRLSPALIRPGRVDRKFLYNYACREQIKAMFNQFYDTSAREDVLNILLDKLSGKKITTAQLQGWFILFCVNIDGLLQGVDNFVEQSEKDNSTTDIAKQSEQDSTKSKEG